MAEAAEKLEIIEINPTLEAFKPFENLSKCLLDAYAVVDAKGKVLKCNALLSQITGIRTKQILKMDSLEQMLTFVMADRVLTMNALINSAGPCRYDEVTGKTTVNGQSLNLIIGVFPFVEDGKPIGGFILLRDVTAETNLQGKYKDKATQSITDNLTGLYNRTYFTDYLTSQLTSLEQLPEAAEQRNISVAMLDIDFFKKINDVYGHQAGDFVLQNVGALLKKVFRRTDVVARYGGEEFLAILPSTDLIGASVAAEKLRAAVADFKFDFNGTVIPVTISSGVSQILVGQESGSEAIARADSALYYSKKSGRNRVTLHNGKEPVEPSKELILASQN